MSVSASVKSVRVKDNLGLRKAKAGALFYEHINKCELGVQLVVKRTVWKAKTLGKLRKLQVLAKVY